MMTVRSEADNRDDDVEHNRSSYSGQEQVGTEVQQTRVNDRDLESAAPPHFAIENENGSDCVVADDDNDDDDVTVIILEPGDDEDELVGSGWVDQDSPEIRERRRNVLLRELQRVQRASFIHFMVLCLIPTSLLFIVIATVVGDDDDCESVATTCEKEPRTFISTCDM
jgi:hypothetical protein